MGSNNTGVTDELLRKSIQQTLGSTTEISADIQGKLFNNQNLVTMVNINEIRKMDPIAILGLPELRASFILIYNTRQRNQGGAYFFDREMNFIRKLWAETDWMKKAEQWSLYTTLLNLAYYGLSIEPIAKAPAYIFPRGGGNRLVYDISAYGDLVLKVGPDRKVKDVGGPYFVYEGDEIRMKDGKISHDSRMETTTIVGVWGRIFTENKRNKDGIETSEVNREVYQDKYYPMDTILTWKKKSMTPNSLGWTGGVEGQPTLGFLEAKVLKHLLALYPRSVQAKQGVTFGAALDEEEGESAADAAYAAAIGEITNNGDEDNTPYEEVPTTDQQAANGQETPQPVEVATPPPPAQKKLSKNFDF